MNAIKQNIISEAEKKAAHYSVKYADANIIDVSTSSRIVTGFFNSYNFFDSDKDVLIMGSAKKSIEERGVNSTAVAKIKHALNHDLTTLVGKLQVLEETTKNGITGIYFESKIANTTLGNDTLINYKEGIYDNHSIGFKYNQLSLIESEKNPVAWNEVVSKLVNPEEAEKYGYLYLVKEINLFEGSTVAFGANSLTPFLGVKSGSKESMTLALVSKLNQLEYTVKNGMQSDEMLSTFELQIKQFKQILKEIEVAETFDKPTLAKVPSEAKSSEPIKPKFDVNQIIKNLNF
jgi:HK97 family phage prohead protease